MVSDVCVDVPVEECRGEKESKIIFNRNRLENIYFLDTFERECRDVPMTIDVPVSKTVCIRSERSCFSMASADEFLNMVHINHHFVMKLFINSYLFVITG